MTDRGDELDSGEPDDLGDDEPTSAEFIEAFEAAEAAEGAEGDDG